jgi:L-asparaginase
MPRRAVGRDSTVFERTYGLPGSEMNLIACGAIPAGYLTGSKACPLLRLLISAGLTGEELRANFVSRSRAALIGGP